MKDNIDKWFNLEASKIRGIINYWRNYHNKNYNVSDMISDVYIHVIKNISNINNISQLEAIVFNYIKDNTYWPMSSINKDYKTNKDYLKCNSSEFIDDYIIIDDDLSLNDKMLVEIRINYLYDFRNTLTDVEERVYFTRWIEILQDGEKPSTNRMSIEFNIKKYQSVKLNKELLFRLNNYLIKNNYKIEGEIFKKKGGRPRKNNKNI